MDFSKEWEDAASCRCSDRLKPLERRKARQHQRCLAHSLVGTPNYIAPEVLLRTGTATHTHVRGRSQLEDTLLQSHSCSRLSCGRFQVDSYEDELRKLPL